MTSDMSELETLAFHWADAYLLSYSRDRWVALRRDTRRFLIAGTLTGLEHAIQDDYRHHPVSRASDPPGTADCLNLDDGDVPADGDVPDEETRFILAALRYAFPAWTITYSPPAAGLDRSQLRKDHLPELPGAAVRRADADRARATIGVGTAPFRERPGHVRAVSPNRSSAGTRRHRPGNQPGSLPARPSGQVGTHPSAGSRA